MATPAQIQANRLNAQRSTGPRTGAGRDASRFNALKHGADAHSLVIPGEDPAELEALALDYHRRFRPDGPMEAFFVETMIKSDWDRRRYARIEAQYLHVQFAALEEPTDTPLGVIFHNDARKGNVLQKLFRRQASAERSYFRALAELRRAQRERLQEELEQMEQEEVETPLAASPQAIAHSDTHAVNPLESTPIGFVLPRPLPDRTQTAMPVR